MMKYFFWIAFAVFLAASIPHVAYFFASFEPTHEPTGIWWWIVSYAIAISIDVTVYLLSWTAFQRYRKYRTPKAVWQHWLLISICTFFSWGVNWAYAKQFHSGSMLLAAETVAPWLSGIFPFMASAFPLLGIVYTMMAETLTETEAEEKKKRSSGELNKQTQLSFANLRQALLRSQQNNLNTHLLASRNQAPAPVAPHPTRENTSHLNAITGHFVALTDDQPTAKEPAVKAGGENMADKLHMTIEALKRQPDMSDEALAEYLSLRRPASARFWRLKAIEIINNQNKELVIPAGSDQTTWNGHTPN
jgi:hypothetical protein